MKIIRILSIILLAFIFNSQVLADDLVVPDSQLMTEVKDKIEADKSLAGANIDVTVESRDQVIIFTGIVNSNSQAETMITLAQSTPGVQDVDTTNLQVKDSTQPLTDAYITAKVKGKLIREKLFGDDDVTPMTVHVETNNGVVYLTGNAETREQVENAVKIAKSVKDVKSVRYRIQLTKGEIINLD